MTWMFGPNVGIKRVSVRARYEHFMDFMIGCIDTPELAVLPIVLHSAHLRNLLLCHPGSS